MAGKSRYKNLSPGEFKQKISALRSLLETCSVCPHLCKIDRLKGEVGFCGAGDMLKIAGWSPHFGEEDVLVGTHGSGTIFFSYCNLRCEYCQNYTISQGLEGRDVSPNELAQIMLNLQGKGCHNINLVSPTHFVPQIIQGISAASQKGLEIPIVYNTSGYDSLITLAQLDGVIDIYMPDTKYMDESTARKYSGIPNYPHVLKAALKEMYRQVGNLSIENGIAVQGLLVRHLLLPGGLAGTRELLDFIAREISTDTYINLMGQYYPAYRSHLYPELSRNITKKELLKMHQHAKELKLTRCIL